MREFALVDGDGEEYSLTVEDSFLHDPSGLGFDHSNTYRQVGPRFIKVNSAINQNIISGKVHFHPDDAYEEYQKFIEFSGRNGLTLKYRLKEIPARSINAKSQTVLWSELSSDIFEGTYDFKDGSYVFSKILIECDGTETVVDKGNGIYGIQGITYNRDTTKLTYCNGLPPLNYDVDDYSFYYGCGTLLGGNSNEIVIAVTDDTLNGDTIREWLAANKPQFCYVLQTPVTGENTDFLFDPDLMYNPIIEGWRYFGTEKSRETVFVEYEDKDGNHVSKNGEKIELENTEFGQNLDSIIIGSNINNQSNSSYFKGTSFLKKRFSDLKWATGDNGYLIKPGAYISNNETVLCPNYVGLLEYGRTYRLSANFKAEHNQGPRSIASAQTSSLKVQCNNVNLSGNDKIRLRLTMFMQDQPQLIGTENRIELFTVEDYVYPKTSYNSGNTEHFIYDYKTNPNDGNAKKYYISIAFNNDVLNKEFTFDGTGTFNCFFGLQITILSNLTGNDLFMGQRSTEEKQDVQDIIIPKALNALPVDSQSDDYIIDYTKIQNYAGPGGGSSELFKAPWTKAQYDRYLGGASEYDDHDLQKAAYYITDERTGGSSSGPEIVVSSSGKIDRAPYSPLIVEEIHNMSLDASSMVKLYNSEGQNYKRLIEVRKVKKTELDKTASLECSVDFECLEPWIDPITVLPERETNNRITFNSDSHTISPCTLYIDGPAESPVWTQIVNGQEIATGKYNGNLANNETLIIHTKPGENGIYILNDGQITDAYQNSDFNTDRFMFILYGENVFEVFGHEYVATEDQTPQDGKTYYTRSGAGTDESPYVYSVFSGSSFVSGTTYYEYTPTVELDCRMDGELYYESV